MSDLAVLCKCGQPENSIRHSFTAASSVDAHEFVPGEKVSDKASPEPIQPLCTHDRTGGGNDYLQCFDCGIEWDYRRVPKPEPSPIPVGFVQLWSVAAPLSSPSPQPAESCARLGPSGAVCGRLKSEHLNPKQFVEAASPHKDEPSPLSCTGTYPLGASSENVTVSSGFLRYLDVQKEDKMARADQNVKGDEPSREAFIALEKEWMAQTEFLDYRNWLQDELIKARGQARLSTEAVKK